jgi:hypothetical protein
MGAAWLCVLIPPPKGEVDAERSEAAGGGVFPAWYAVVLLCCVFSFLPLRGRWTPKRSEAAGGGAALVHRVQLRAELGEGLRR